MRKFALALAIGLTTAACLGSDFNESLTGDWQLVEGEMDGHDLVLVPSHPATMTITEGALGGTASCNGYGGTFQLSGSNISITEIFSTEMACFPAETMTLESAFIEALQRVDQVIIDETLSLVGDNVRLTFEKLEPVPDAELTGTVWVLDALIQGEAVTSVSGDRATLEFFSDGSMIGSTGCRGLTGQWTISGSEVVMTELGASGDCSSELAAQDSHVISSLEGGFRVEIDGERLTTWSRGDEGLTYTADG